jgi:hypothetical protein
MIYELAKLLKDAGFPKKTLLDLDTKDVYKPYDVEMLYTLNAPTLSELIKACEISVDSFHFFALTYLKKYKHWRVIMGIRDGSVKEIGQTPEEAVAKLWLALNKK